MAHAISITECGRRVVFEADGPVDGKELVDVHREFLETREHELHGCRTWFVDFARALPGDAAGGDIRLLADLAVTLSERVPLRAVAVHAPGDLDFGLARMWGVLAEKSGWHIRIFRSRSEATVWLETFEEAVEGSS